MYTERFCSSFRIKNDQMIRTKGMTMGTTYYTHFRKIKKITEYTAYNQNILLQTSADSNLFNIISVVFMIKYSNHSVCYLIWKVLI